MPGNAAFRTARARPRGTPAIGVGAGIGRVGQDAEDGDAGGRAPGDLTLGRAMTGPIRQIDVVRYQVTHHAVGAAASLEDVEDQAQRITHPLVRIEDGLARRATQEAARQVEAQLAALGLVPAPSSNRARMMWSSASLMVPLRPSKRRRVEPRVVHAAVVADEGAPRAQIPSRSYQSRQERARRETSKPSTRPTWPRPTSATNLWKPGRRAAEAPGSRGRRR